MQQLDFFTKCAPPFFEKQTPPFSAMCDVTFFSCSRGRIDVYLNQEIDVEFNFKKNIVEQKIQTIISYGLTSLYRLVMPHVRYDTCFEDLT